MDKKKILEYNVKGPYLLSVDEDRSEQKSGCSVVDISFNDLVSIGEITFRNYYTAYISIMCKRVPSDKDVKNRDTLPWQVITKHMVLMKNPHCEQGSQDIYAIHSDKTLIPWTGIVHLRFVLRQPSPLWRKFSIEDLSFYKEMPPEPKSQTFVPRMFAATTKGSKNGFHEKAIIKDSTGSIVGSGNSVSDAPTSLQNLKNITELMKEMHTGASVGRFEVDGSYDIDLLDVK